MENKRHLNSLMKKRLYYRQKSILEILQLFNKKIIKNNFQKYLFLFAQSQEEPVYNFLPSKQGPYSFQAYKDIRFLEESKLIHLDKNYIRLQINKSFFDELKLKDKKILLNLKSKFNGYNEENLLKYIGKKYSYFINQSKTNNKNYLNEEQINSQHILFTIGYEGKSIDLYLNQLINNNIRLLVDVRKNPNSRKYGFSKKVLGQLCSKVGISYQHIHKLGINSDKRKKLETISDYENLFSEYKRTILENNQEILFKIIAKIKYKQRIALTCFEENPNYCHRKQISNEIATLNNNCDFEVQHL